MTSPRFSAVIPAYNEEENILPLLEELVPAMEAIPGGYEIIIVDDGSTDGTRARLEAAKGDWPALRVLRMKANAGQSAAFVAGFDAAHGEIVITLDADLQNNPADIPRLVSHLDEFDVVCGIRRKRRDSWLRRMSSSTARRVRQSVLKDSIADVGCSIRAFRKQHAVELPRFDGMHRFIPVFLEWQGLSIHQVDVDHRPRSAGTSKYGVWNRLPATLADLMAVRWLKSRRINYEIEE
jgi:glycosyltransferase involved in cell wall biosynthesis